MLGFGARTRRQNTTFGIYNTTESGTMARGNGPPAACQGHMVLVTYGLLPAGLGEVPVGPGETLVPADSGIRASGE